MYSRKSGPRSFSNQPFAHSLRMRKRAAGNIAQLVFRRCPRPRRSRPRAAAPDGCAAWSTARPRQPELLPVCHAEHIERVRVQRPVRGRERREQLVRHGFKKFHKRYPPAEGALPLVFRLIQLYGFRADFTMCSLSEKVPFHAKAVRSPLPGRTGTRSRCTISC